MNYHQGRNSGPNLDGGEEIRTPVNFVHPWLQPLKNIAKKRIFPQLESKKLKEWRGSSRFIYGIVV